MTPNKTDLQVVTFNLHGFNQGHLAITELINTNSPDIFLIQEHWLTPAGLGKFEELYTDYRASVAR
jgi:exonuclease III